MTAPKPSAAMEAAELFGLWCDACVESEVIANCKACREVHMRLAAQFDAFAAEAVKAEREACAAIADRDDQSAWGIAYEIRSRGEQ